jgi:hypothetical protein
MMHGIPLRPRRLLLLGMTVALAAATGACRYETPIGLNPNAMRELSIPAVGQTQAAVVELNGGPDHREKTDSLEMWVYARTLPPVDGLQSKSAIIWFRDGVVVRVGASGGFSAPNPTFPPPQPLQPAAGEADAS